MIQVFNTWLQCDSSQQLQSVRCLKIMNLVHILREILREFPQGILPNMETLVLMHIWKNISHSFTRKIVEILLEISFSIPQELSTILLQQYLNLNFESILAKTVLIKYKICYELLLLLEFRKTISGKILDGYLVDVGQTECSTPRQSCRYN